jgi:hypothetical protein
VSVLRWKNTGITIAGQTSTLGSSSSQLNAPREAVWHYPNSLYIADYENHRIQRYEIGSSTGSTVAGNGSLGNASNRLYHPTRVLIDSNSGILISDSGNNRIQFWSNGATSGVTTAGIGK